MISSKTYCHIIPSLKTGGAERMLVRLLSNTSVGDQHMVICMQYGGQQAKELIGLGVDVHTVGLNIWSLLKFFKKNHSDVYIGWMYYGNLLATLFGWLFSKPVIWNIRHSVENIRVEKLTLRLAIRMCAILSHSPQKIIYNSRIAVSQHAVLGFELGQSVVLPNGVDTSIFKASKTTRIDFRKEFGLSSKTLVIGHLARFHPMKDHIRFLRAAKYIVNYFPNSYFVLAGRGVDSKNLQLVDEIERLNITNKVSLTGERDDIANFLSSLDLLIVSSAWGEAFPNVLIEAMSCEVPVITTNVGDAAYIVADPSRVVPTKNHIQLAQAAVDFLSHNYKTRRIVGKINRNRVIEFYNIDKIKASYQSIWSAVILGDKK